MVRDKLLAAKILNKSVINTDETSLLLDIIDNEDADSEDRRLAAKSLYEIAENQWRATKEIAERYKIKWMELEHGKFKQKETDNLVQGIQQANLSDEEMLKVLQKMLEKRG